MLSKTAFNITYKACLIRVREGEDINEIIEDYSKLSDEQKSELIAKIESEANKNED